MVMGGAVQVLRNVPFTFPLPISYKSFVESLRDYSTQYGPPSGLLPAVGPPPLTPTDREPDLADYGLPRLLICQQPAVTRMLIANSVHVELSCAILSLSEAKPLPEAIKAMLRRTPGARVFMLHDASAEGLALVPQLREQIELPAELSLTPLGLRPDHAFRLHLFATRRRISTDQSGDWPAYLSARERGWLQAGWQVEVEALHPVMLLRALRRGLLGLGPITSKTLSLRRLRTVGFMTWPDH